MNHKRKISRKNTARVSRDVNNASIGTHVQHSSGYVRGADTRGANFSAAPRTRAVQGEVRHITPNTRTQESKASYSRRRNDSGFATNRARKIQHRRLLMPIIIVMLLVAFAVSVGFFFYTHSTNAGISLDDQNLEKVLVAPHEDEPYYVLIAGNLDTTSATFSHQGPDILSLVRIDPGSRSLSLLQIPPEYQWVENNESKQLCETAEEGNDVLVRAVSSITGVDISHFVTFDEQGIVNLVDMVGGVTVDVPEVIDDPSAGWMYIEAGEQTLDGEGFVTLLRANNLTNGNLSRLENQAEAAASCLAAVLGGTESFHFASKLGEMDGIFATDYTAGELKNLSNEFEGISAGDVYFSSVPGYWTKSTKLGEAAVEYFTPTKQAWNDMLERFIAGDDPRASLEVEVDAANPADCTVEVQNGTNIAGAAGVTGDYLASKGFAVEDLSNAEMPVYDETLIIYDEENKSKAVSVQNALGFGRVLEGQGFYSFDSDVLVVIGADYKPLG